MKETVVLYSKPATNVIEYSLELRGLQVGAAAGGVGAGLAPPTQPDGSLALNDPDGRTIFTVPPPTVRDARGSRGAAAYRYTPPPILGEGQGRGPSKSSSTQPGSAPPSTP
jgi:hypothetical protein